MQISIYFLLNHLLIPIFSDIPKENVNWPANFSLWRWADFPEKWTRVDEASKMILDFFDNFFHCLN